MSTTTTIEEHEMTRSYKNMWARYVAKSTMNYDLKGAINLAKDVQARIPNLHDHDKVKGGENIGQLFDKTKKITGTGFVPEKPGKIDVGIVGAGVAGLFTALVFDWLNDHPQLQGQGLKINYDILEAAGEERLGGRLYTHHFSDEKHDYYDVGAMRFPNNSIMKRTFQLFNYIGLKQNTTPGLIPYYLKDSLGVCPSYFNDVSKVGNVWTESADDPYNVNSGLPPNGRIPPELLKQNPNKLVSDALQGFITEVRDQFKKVVKEGDENNGEEATALWKRLIKADHMSVRQFLGSGQEKDKVPQKAKPDFPEGPGYNYNTIEWLETATYGTGWYDQALTECVLEELDFHTDDEDKGNGNTQYWWCVDGGAQEIAKKMAEKAKQSVQYHTQVEAIDAQTDQRKDPDKFTAIKIRTITTDPATNQSKEKEKDYFAVFNSTTLAALQRMDLKDAGLLWGTKQAIRALGYGASSKVGMKFRTAWWQKKPFNITQGGVSRTDLPLRVCVYPSYNIRENEGDSWDPEKPAVLLCSYTWGQDAQRIGALCSPDTPENEDQLKRTMLHDLALLHANKECPYKDLLKLLNEQYMDHHSWDWYRDQHMSGAFAYFGPGQFSNMWQEIIKPNAFGQLYLIGEASSSHHAWIVGALESVIRAIYVMFQGLQSHDPEFKAYETVLTLLSQAPTDPGEEWDAEDGKGDDQGSPAPPAAPMKKNGAMPKGLPFHPLPEEMPTLQFKAPMDTPLTQDPKEEADSGNNELLTYGAALAVLSLIESYLELTDPALAKRG
ncbi:hypothetical protein FZEAL_3722 [Fusarium zealandicum]|uniref:Amine oxidase domain-containing protein n=1 Tax=Fusarium zealandicum TaxID=1053134 RepID=A0A8H4XMM3_9HYPO|nr:hypothetical protein FZEAL_3722 [Fusarium zealandicum]